MTSPDRNDPTSRSLLQRAAKADWAAKTFAFVFTLLIGLSAAFLMVVHLVWCLCGSNFDDWLARRRAKARDRAAARAAREWQKVIDEHERQAGCRDRD